ncbi:MAG: hypothetical protein KA885_01485 [Spirochaetes bacterium]|nr:hypothetical protein [Spirochaetota bacterium]
MATNKPYGDGHRNGAVKNRVQYYNPQNGCFVKFDTETNRILDVKSDGKPFKGVTKK